MVHLLINMCHEHGLHEVLAIGDDDAVSVLAIYAWTDFLDEEDLEGRVGVVEGLVVVTVVDVVKTHADACSELGSTGRQDGHPAAQRTLESSRCANPLTQVHENGKLQYDKEAATVRIRKYELT